MRFLPTSRIARPVVSTERVFLRVQAPFTPLRSSAEIAGIVARVLKRGGFSGLPTGARVFRHSLASAWLRGRAVVDAVVVAFRHASRDTTAITRRWMSRCWLASPNPGREGEGDHPPPVLIATSSCIAPLARSSTRREGAAPSSQYSSPKGPPFP